MKKVFLMILSVFFMPSVLLAQYWGPVWHSDGSTRNICNDAARDTKKVCKYVKENSKQMTNSIGEAIDKAFSDSEWYQRQKANLEAVGNRFKDMPYIVEDYWNPPATIQNIPAPTNGVFKVIHDRTESALTNAFQDKITGRILGYRWSYEFPTAKSAVLAKARNIAQRSEKVLLTQLKESPFSQHKPVEGQTRMAYEYRQAILECGGLDACLNEVKANYTEREIATFEKILKTREEWLYYKNANPLFSLYRINGNFETLLFLSKGSDYQKLVDFFAGKGDWSYELMGETWYMVDENINIFGEGTIQGREIVVTLSDALQVVILPENLSIRILYKLFSRRKFDIRIEEIQPVKL